MSHFIVRIFQFVALVGCLSSSIYYLICLWSVLLFLRGRKAGRSASLSHAAPGFDS